MRTVVFLACVMSMLYLPAFAQDATFTLQDYLGRNWRNECVTYPLTPTIKRHIDAKHALVGPDDQVLPGRGKEPRLAFNADLNAFEIRRYRFTEQPAVTTSDLKIEETPDAIRITNGWTGIMVPKMLKDGQGPLGAIRMNSGAWVGGSRLTGTTPVTAYQAEVTMRGPVMAEVTCHTQFTEAQQWTLTFRVQANEPVIEVNDNASLRGDSTFTVLLSPQLKPDSLLFRYGKGGNAGYNDVWKIAQGEAYMLEPFLMWWQHDRQGPCFGVFREDGKDFLGVGAGFSASWVDPDRPSWEQASPQIPVTNSWDNELRIPFTLKRGQRQWMVMALNKDDCLTGLKAQNPADQNTLPYQYLIKHGHFPLDLVKDYVLQWADAGPKHPHLLITRDQANRWRANLSDAERLRYQGALPALKNHVGPIEQFSMSDHLGAYFATDDPGLERALIENATITLQQTIDEFFTQHQFPLGAAPHHHQDFGTSVTLADAILDSPQLDPKLRARLLAQIAFIGYTCSRPDFWSPERGYWLTPNMTSSVQGYLATAACCIPSHPMAKVWARQSLGELKRQIEEWSDANGGWLEAPHYAMVSYDQILGAFIMAHNAGLDDYLFAPKMKAVANWFSQITTPPDSRFGGFRHLPCIGNTYINEPTGEFGILATIWRERDPEFSAQMQWMFQQHLSWPYPGIGGGYPGIAGYRAMLLDPKLPSKPPAWRSELFPKTGVMLRNGFPSAQETMLHMIAGPNHDHYDYDSGSITVWGKGRILADDFGYYGRVPANDHNLVESAAMGTIMNVKAFESAPALDYIHGVADGWTRQIAFVKRADLLAPNYFVMTDTLATPMNATWRLWCTAAEVKLTPQGATVIGKGDVDMDIVFLNPAGKAFSTETITRKAGAGLDAQGKATAEASYTTQTGLIARVASGGSFAAVLYPRMKGEAAPVITALADGKGVKIQHAKGTDYVFLSTIPFTYQEGNISFDGTAGSIQLNADGPVLSLGAPGRIAAVGKELRKD